MWAKSLKFSFSFFQEFGPLSFAFGVSARNGTLEGLKRGDGMGFVYIPIPIGSMYGVFTCTLITLKMN